MHHLMRASQTMTSRRGLVALTPSRVPHSNECICVSLVIWRAKLSLVIRTQKVAYLGDCVRRRRAQSSSRGCAASVGAPLIRRVRASACEAAITRTAVSPDSSGSKIRVM